MPAGKYRFTLQSIEWLTPTVMEITFTSPKKVHFQGGQFLSIYVPDLVSGKSVRRAYSFSSAPEAKEMQLCVKYVPGGAGTEFLRSLKPGDQFEASAPYGHFVYRPLQQPNVCFIATSTGIAPFRSMVLSKEFLENRPEHCLVLYGATNESEIIYPGFFEQAGIETVNALSRSPAHFSGRVSDYLKQLPNSWKWHNTDFYLCGNGDMIAEVKEILRGGHGVPPAHIHMENFSPKKKKAA
jgi:benzoate/toluate 1,2-dioxygenase reductase subunit